MPKIDLRFLDCLDSNDYIKVSTIPLDNGRSDAVFIEGIANNEAFDIYLDKSTAIRFSKALRTAINQIK